MLPLELNEPLVERNIWKSGRFMIEKKLEIVLFVGGPHGVHMKRSAQNAKRITKQTIQVPLLRRARKKLTQDSSKRRPDRLFFICSVPRARLELASHYWQRILSPSCIPIPPPGQSFVKVEAAAGLAPANRGFADHCVSYFAMPPIANTITFLWFFEESLRYGWRVFRIYQFQILFWVPDA